MRSATALPDDGIGPEELKRESPHREIRHDVPGRTALLAEFAEAIRLVVWKKSAASSSYNREVLYNRANRPIIISKQNEKAVKACCGRKRSSIRGYRQALGSVNFNLASDEKFDERLVDREISALLRESVSDPRPNTTNRLSTQPLHGTAGRSNCRRRHRMPRDGGDSRPLRRSRWAEAHEVEGAPGSTCSTLERKHIRKIAGERHYFCSGQLALGASVSPTSTSVQGHLYNGTVAMTGGQEAAGALRNSGLTRQ